ncbi:hypothetical protein VC83_04524 [Pseudogymnoascus destructans]|uniref:Uncharacterized protein n=2 Tax=Pseudogymnoascus destructans TaxID=655981 RepID=L8G6C8_PSED2|nr:uncharacterized protein VC83_04524 [Pseudogymnoascus destructans]ELR08228.1 hypothetical protein GMDG_03030 [Pseudogymnoascus destructans 20631-21]OAF57327.1 hypothetical protein VC83_04524 [Pseudogymnoascus destructans]
MKRALTHAPSSLRLPSSTNAVRYYFFSSTTSPAQPAKESTEPTQPAKSSTPETPAEPVKVNVRAKTIAELDEELKLKLEEISGEGGAAGLEYENGKAVAMKRGVKENMFRLI